MNLIGDILGALGKGPTQPGMESGGSVTTPSSLPGLTPGTTVQSPVSPAHAFFHNLGRSLFMNMMGQGQYTPQRIASQSISAAAKARKAKKLGQSKNQVNGPFNNSGPFNNVGGN